MKRKILVGMGLMLASIAIVYALTFSNPYPNGDILNGTTHWFNVTGDVPMSTGWVLIDNNTGTTSYSMACSGTVCNASIDLSSYDDFKSYRHYYFVDGTPSAWYTFSINRVPSQPAGLQATGYNESALNISWTLNSETDIVEYRLYRNDSANVELSDNYNIANLSNTTNSYLDSGLILGNTYYYKLTATDNISQSTISSEISGIVADSTPPSVPIIDPSSGSTANTSTPSINITYPDIQNVTLRIYSGTTLVKDFSSTPALNFTWNPILAENTTYVFKLNAYDPFGNERNTSYTLTTTEMDDINFSILDTTHITKTSSAVISSALPGEYILLKYDVSFYGGTYVRVRMTDLVSASGTIDITGDTQPFIFCAESYDIGNRDYNGTGDIDYVLNSYNESATPLSCQDNNPSSVIDWTLYLKIPIPATTISDSYTSTVSIGLY